MNNAPDLASFLTETFITVAICYLIVELGAFITILWVIYKEYRKVLSSKEAQVLSSGLEFTPEEAAREWPGCKY